MNFSKSCIMFSRNASQESISEITNILRVPQAPNIDKYLGFPIGVGRNKKKAFSYIEIENWRVGDKQ